MNIIKLSYYFLKLLLTFIFISKTIKRGGLIFFFVFLTKNKNKFRFLKVKEMNLK